jgi:PEP-CTERM motif
MKNNLIKLLPALLLGFGASAFAAPVTTTIADTFVGGQDNVSPARDIIGDANSFDVDRMDVTIDRAAGTLSVKIATQWYDPTSNGVFNFGEGYDVQSGDLFISTNGWAPFGAAPYDADDASNGEAWEYVFDTTNSNIYGGAFGISNTQDEMVGPLVGSDGNNAYRDNQETRRTDGGNQTGSGTITWSLAGDNSIAFVQYDLTLAALGIDPNGPINLGFHWTMTCGNDVIEGGVDGGPGNEIPEPGIVLLFGLGLLGLGLRRRAS